MAHHQVLGRSQGGGAELATRNQNSFFFGNVSENTAENSRLSFSLLFCEVATSFESQQKAAEGGFGTLREELSKGLTESASALLSTKNLLDSDVQQHRQELEKKLEAAGSESTS